jgi:DNA-directed RNA polymerase subunit L
MKHGGLKVAPPKETWETLLNAANNDFVSVLVLWYVGIVPASTYAWMFPHTLEKYLKAYLLRTKSVTSAQLKSFGKSGHSLRDIWEKYKSICTSTTTKPKLNAAFDDIIADLDTISTQVRYSGHLDLSSDGLLYFYIVLCSLLRYLLIGKQEYRSSLYGLKGCYFLPMNHSPVMAGYGETIVTKMLHLSLEHGASFTNMGFVNQMPFDDFSISNTAIFQ